MPARGLRLDDINNLRAHSSIAPQKRSFQLSPALSAHFSDYTTRWPRCDSFRVGDNSPRTSAFASHNPVLALALGRATRSEMPKSSRNEVIEGTNLGKHALQLGIPAMTIKNP